MLQYGYGYALNTYFTAGLALNGAHQEKNTQELSPGVVSMVVESSPMVTGMVSVPSRCCNRSRRRSCSHSCRWSGWRLWR